MNYDAIIMTTTGNYEDECKRLYKEIEEADAIIVGAGAGLSSSAGLNFDGDRLKQHFGDFIQKYGIKDMYTGCFTDFESNEERWAYWSRWAYINRYLDIPKDTHKKLYELIKDKDYFVLTTNIDHTFQRAGYPKERLCYTQGDFGLFQCSSPCHTSTYDNYELLKKMYETQKDMKVDSSLIPHCPKCNKEMDFNLYWDHTFVRDEGWHIAHHRYLEYIEKHRNSKIVYLELGVGFNSPGVIKVPFWNLVYKNKNAIFASINLLRPCFPEQIKNQSIVIKEDIDKVINDLCDMKNSSTHK